MNTLYGSYWVLALLPIWATALILYFLVVGVLFILRDRCEGLYYNTSYSSVLGDGALLGVVLIGADILQCFERVPDFTDGWFHILVGVFSIAFGCLWLDRDKPKQWGDRYHHMVIAPMLAYLLITIVPVIFLNGTGIEVIATICLLLFWVDWVLFDYIHHRRDIK